MALFFQPLVIPAIALLAGVVLARTTAFSLAECGLLLGMSVLAAIVSQRLRPVCLPIAFTAAGVLLTIVQDPGPPPEIDAKPAEIVLLSGCVVEPPALSEGREQFVLELALKARVRVSMILRDGEEPPRLRYGQRVEVEARVRIPRNFGNPGSFDYRYYLAVRHIYWTATVPAGAKPRVVGEDCGARAIGILYGFRAALLERIERLYDGDAYTIGVLEALLLGESAKLDKGWADAYRRTGTYHAIVISGMHIAVIAGALVMIFRIVLHQTWASLLALSLIWIYAGMCGWQVPVVRAAGGFTLFSAGRFLFRECRAVNLLAALTLVFLLADSANAFDASFQFSFLAVLGLAALAAPAAEATTAGLRRGLKGFADEGRDMHLDARTAQFRTEMRLLVETFALYRIPEKVGRAMVRSAAWFVFHAWEAFLITAAVQLGLSLLMVFYFHRLSVTGLSANLLVTPLLTAAIPLGFLAVLTTWTPLAQLTAVLVAWARIVAEWHSAIEPGSRVADPPLWLAVLFAVSLVALAISRKTWQLALCLGLLGLIVWRPFEPVRAPGSLELTMIDVGQGDALLVGFPNGEWMGIDAGGIPVFRNRKTTSRMDIGDDVVTPYLLSRGIQALDYVVSTHQHDDHAGGLPAVIDAFRPRELWVGATPDSPTWSGLSRGAAEVGARVRALRRGDTVRIGEVSVDALAPGRDYEPKATASNNDSLVLRMTFRSHCFLLTGDVERREELPMLGDLGRCDVLKVAHHGSRTSTAQIFLDAVQPSFALISLGKDNIFRHPHADILRRLGDRRTAIYRTDEHGLITVRSDGYRFSVETPALVR